MNGMEKITARMEADAARSLSELNGQTERQLREMRQESEKRAEQEREALSQRAKQAAQERYERLCSAAEMETRKLTLSAQQAVLAEAYDRALEKYLDLLVHLLKRAVSTGTEELLLSQKDHDAIGCELTERANRELGTSLTLSDRCADIRAGFLLVSRECDVNCSFETLLALSRERTERGAAELLFAQ